MRVLQLVIPLCIISIACNPSNEYDSNLQDSATVPAEFEGVITYKTHLTDVSDLVDEDMLNRLQGDTARWYYRNGSFRWNYNGEITEKTVYLAETDSLFTKNYGVDTLYTQSVHHVGNGRTGPRTLDSLYVTNVTRTVLGRTCTDVVKIMSGVSYTYCIDKDLYINAERFRSYKHGFLGDVYDLYPGAYLAFKYESRVFVIEHEALEIDERQLVDQVFEIPELPRAIGG